VFIVDLCRFSPHHSFIVTFFTLGSRPFLFCANKQLQDVGLKRVPHTHSTGLVPCVETEYFAVKRRLTNFSPQVHHSKHCLKATLFPSHPTLTERLDVYVNVCIRNFFASRNRSRTTKWSMRETPHSHPTTVARPTTVAFRSFRS
jgi:hypothetical protein